MLANCLWLARTVLRWKTFKQMKKSANQTWKKSVVVSSYCSQTLNLWLSCYTLLAECAKEMHKKCVLHVQHDYFFLIKPTFLFVAGSCRFCSAVVVLVFLFNRKALLEFEHYARHLSISVSYCLYLTWNMLPQQVVVSSLLELAIVEAVN